MSSQYATKTLFLSSEFLLLFCLIYGTSVDKNCQKQYILGDNMGKGAGQAVRSSVTKPLYLMLACKKIQQLLNQWPAVLLADTSPFELMHQQHVTRDGSLWQMGRLPLTECVSNQFMCPIQCDSSVAHCLYSFHPTQCSCTENSSEPAMPAGSKPSKWNGMAF